MGQAGGGAFYIRSRASNLYLTVAPPATAAAGTASMPQPIPPGVIEDVKHIPGTAPAPASETVTVDPPKVARRISCPTGVVRRSEQVRHPERRGPGRDPASPTDQTTPGPVVVRASSLPGGLDARLAWTVTSAPS